MKTTKLIMLGLLLAVGIASGEIVTLIAEAKLSGEPQKFSEELTVGEGTYVELVGAAFGAVIEIVFAEGKVTNDTHPSGGILAPTNVAGPATLRVQNDRARAVFATFRITRQGTDGIIPVPQSPSDTTFEVFLEASSDMETWVRVIPGDYSSNGAAKFFRVRMAAK